jgi:hypothetical protein
MNLSAAFQGKMPPDSGRAMISIGTNLKRGVVATRRDESHSGGQGWEMRAFPGSMRDSIANHWDLRGASTKFSEVYAEMYGVRFVRSRAGDLKGLGSTCGV